MCGSRLSPPKAKFTHPAKRVYLHDLTTFLRLSHPKINEVEQDARLSRV